jgi:ribosome-binding protein aMBF1 (putative translation factor)
MNSAYFYPDPEDETYTVVCYRKEISQAQRDARRLRRLRNYTALQEKLADPMEYFRYEKEQLEMRAAHRAMRLPENSGKTLRDLIHEAQLRGSNDRMPIIIRKNNPNKSGDVERRVVKNKRGEKSSRFQKQLEQNADNGLLDKNLFEMDFIKQVKRYRSKNLLTQKDLAQKINVKEHEIRSFERNELLYDASLKALLTSVLNE